MKNFACVYVLECADGTLYAGWTTDLAARLRAHSAGKGAKYTRSRLPVIVAGWWKAEGRGEALRWEARFRRLTRKEKLTVLAGKDATWPRIRRHQAKN